MKSICCSLYLLIIVFCLNIEKAAAQANTALSNLTATSVSQDLIPSADNTRILGSAVKEWKQLYISNAVFMGGSKFISFGNTLSLGITAVGNNALAANTGGFANTGIGFYSLAANTNGNANAAIGTRSLQANTTGSANMAMGYFSLYSNTTGYSNVAIGVRAMLSSSDGHNQIAIGDSALFTTNGGTGYNTAIGSKALYFNTTGALNTAIGSYALIGNTTGSNNTSVGYHSLTANTYANFNTAVGGSTLYSNISGDGNSAYGAQAMYYNTEGIYGTAVGLDALKSNTTGNLNTAIGAGSIYTNTTGSFNVALGESALYANSTGGSNTAVGSETLNGNVTQSGNTALGYQAGTNTDNISNATSLGFQSQNTASNQVMLGNTSVTSVVTSAPVYTASDGRFKKDIKTNVPGLEFIKELRPVTYHYDIHGINDHIRPASTGQSKNRETQRQAEAVKTLEENAIAAKEKILFTGFVAQEVEKAANKFNYDFSGVYKPQNEKDLYGLSYSDFVVPLVKAVQELSADNDSKQNQIDSLKAGLQELKDLVNKLVNGQATGSMSISDASLGQNLPNPFTGSTSIDFTIPQNSGRARLEVSDLNGRIIKSVAIGSAGRGNLNIDASGLSSGVYTYTLYVNEKMIGSKQMVVTK